MLQPSKQLCPECQPTSMPSPEKHGGLDRRHFMRALSGTAATLLAGGAPQFAAAQATPQQAANPPATVAEDLVRELYQSLSAQQRAQTTFPWNHGQSANQLPTRLRFFNQAFGQTISQYTPGQRELNERILRAVLSEDDGYERISTVLRTDNWNSSGLGGAGVAIFGNPLDGQFAWLFTAHHMTLRCDGDSHPNAAFGGPLFYGHLVEGYSDRNVWNYQTKSVQGVFEALSEAQRNRAVLAGSPGENYQSVRFRADSTARPGLPIAELSQTQRSQVLDVMRDLLRPFRKVEVDEAMDLLSRTGGLDRISLAFYRDAGTTDNLRWHFWRLEGPGFVWNYRILPHVHCFVNIGVA